MLGDGSVAWDERMGEGGCQQWITLTVCIQIRQRATRDQKADNRFNISVSVWWWCELALPTSPSLPPHYYICLLSVNHCGDDDGCGGSHMPVGLLLEEEGGQHGKSPARPPSARHDTLARKTITHVITRTKQSTFHRMQYYHIYLSTLWV